MKLLIWMVLLLWAVAGTAARGQTDSNCPNSTVEDAWGAEFASRAKAFLAKLQEVVKSNDTKRFATLVQYPVRVFDGSNPAQIRTPTELIRRYPSIMTPKLVEAVLSQSPVCLFGNGQGVMIGRGQIWFSEQSSGLMKIVAINLTAPNSR